MFFRRSRRVNQEAILQSVKQRIAKRLDIESVESAGSHWYTLGLVNRFRIEQYLKVNFDNNSRFESGINSKKRFHLKPWHLPTISIIQLLKSILSIKYRLNWERICQKHWRFLRIVRLSGSLALFTHHNNQPLHILHCTSTVIKFHWKNGLAEDIWSHETKKAFKQVVYFR